jgi:hypothetical protein
VTRRCFFNSIRHGLFSCSMIWDERWLSFLLWVELFTITFETFFS